MTPSIKQTVGNRELDVLELMSVACPVSHLKMSALKAAAPSNTTQHPNVVNNEHEKVEGTRKDAKNQQTAGNELKMNQKNKSVTPSNEQTV